MLCTHAYTYVAEYNCVLVYILYVCTYSICVPSMYGWMFCVVGMICIHITEYKLSIDFKY